jgi:hypothetical protein
MDPLETLEVLGKAPIQHRPGASNSGQVRFSALDSPTGS